ncbi:MAG: tRNA (adenosine(37)-N6)-dimethylallyltransferase MiaA [Rhodospirillales bacterium]|jgi:tRNA dimethylallyltransferase|nr:tRNA (adenosine(37)-N6)-dimethylallyltransferase MiaA [Rhodospirillales bacterium]MBT4007609.1 tRNA (adenosine(37)-N6)-dimethylallyltransferase MiaA [Rhodospirillales bacterium]MBT5076647.1 tRNA (adenosine(37)-N6)-dimethylallyltransferase MiaA [Rhodospirillales bacterium]MBT5113731.1 tRNA (adenosine(37)-N6)-dimethylallyltransferase MiaA [Rhodospirillales bacterium]MBT5674033.1 tRNA (adenosine(37)-N6)-dimethylallyltransferase MiaA [Rhodospirillales bacterium]
MSATDLKTIYVVAGPTASGKSGLGIVLAEHLDGVIVNADSMQIYQGLEILTAQPDADDLARVPHRLYGVMDPADVCSAGLWRQMAIDEINQIFRSGKTPIIVGGSGLYLQALMEGIAPIPDIPGDIRANIRAHHGEIGNEAFRAELLASDPGSASIGATDAQRMIRAMEVWSATGRSLKSWQGEPKQGPDPDWHFISILLDPPRADVYAAIEERFDQMIDAGAMAEAMALGDRALDSGLPAMKALGVAELIKAGRGEIPMEAALTRAKTLSRNYAKRQITWFKGQMIADKTIFEKYSERFKGKILSYIL